MSSVGDLAFLRAAIFAQLQQRTQPLSVPPNHPEQGWLDWLEIPCTSGPLPPLNLEPIALQAANLKADGILPEVVYGCLVQTWWHPGQSDWVARTRSEIYACYAPDQLDIPGWSLSLEAIRKVNAYRLQELTPSELLEASRPFWNGPGVEPERMEGWVLLHLDRFERLQDVADCLYPFLHQGPAPTGQDPHHSLRIPPGLEWEEAVQILGEERVERLLMSKERPL